MVSKAATHMLTHAHTHIHIPTYEQKQFQETRHAWQRPCIPGLKINFIVVKHYQLVAGLNHGYMFSILRNITSAIILPAGNRYENQTYSKHQKTR